MMPPLLLAAVVVLGAPPDAARLTGATLTFEVAAQPFANFIYGLNCISGVTVCSADAFREAWQEHGVLQAADEPLLRQWAEVVGRYRQFLDFADAQALVLPGPLTHGPGVDWNEKFVMAGYGSADPQAFAQNLSLLVTPTDVPVLMAVVTRFHPRFAAWFAGEPQQRSGAFAEGLQQLMVAHRLLAFTEAMAAFYRSALPPGQPLLFHVIYRPRTREERRSHHVKTYATVPENHAAIEMVDNEEPKERVDVVMHELFHFLYWTRSMADHVDLVNLFAATGHPAAMGVYSILDEALAAAAGNGLVAREVLGPQAFARSMKKNGLYDEPFINRLGMALMPVLAAHLKKGGTLDGTFVKTVMALAPRALGADIHSVHLLLKTRNLVVLTRAGRPWCQRFKAAFRATSNSINVGNSDWAMETYPQMSGAVMLLEGQLGEVAHHSTLVDGVTPATLRGALGAHRGVAVGIRRSAMADVYVLVAREPADMEALVAAFVRPRARFVGAGVTVD